MKRYWLFMFSNYYPQGGMNDFSESFDTVEDCHKKYNDECEKWEYDHYQIFDMGNKQMIYMKQYNGVYENITFEELYKINNPYGK